jgi:hypothetical protein
VTNDVSPVCIASAPERFHAPQHFIPLVFMPVLQKALLDKMKAEYAMYEETPQAVLSASGDGQAPANRPVNVQVACMSKAGKEPGYRKTNQDNCFAFEKYIAEDQSLFGAMDGHGPQGELQLQHASCITKPYL